jgi:Ca2+-binding EF-hand superfamily protein
MFKQFDTDASGFITVQDITEAMHKFGHRISAEEIHEIMKKHAVANPNQINFEEFKKIFEDLQ